MNLSNLPGSGMTRVLLLPMLMLPLLLLFLVVSGPVPAHAASRVSVAASSSTDVAPSDVPNGVWRHYLSEGIDALNGVWRSFLESLFGTPASTPPSSDEGSVPTTITVTTPPASTIPTPDQIPTTDASPTPVAVVTPSPVAEDPTPTVSPDPAPAVAPVSSDTSPVVGAAPTPASVPTPAPEPTAAPTTRRWIGYYVPGVPANMDPLLAVESETGAHAAVINFFISDGNSFPAPQSENAVSHGSIPLVTWDFTSIRNVYDITDGSRDAYIRDFAKAARSFGHEVWLRPFNEMNGNWSPWSGTLNGNSPAAVADAWRHIRDIFAQEGATNVKFVWTMNATSVPDTAANAIKNYWPGDAYVDYLGLDGYNWGTSTTSTWSTWQSFSAVFGSGYANVTALSSKPVIIPEVGSATTGGDKAAWIADMFNVIPARFPRIAGFSWFDVNKERDWRIDSDPESLATFSAYAAGF